MKQLLTGLILGAIIGAFIVQALPTDAGSWLSDLFRSQDPRNMTEDELLDEIAKMQDEIREITLDQELTGFNQTWDDVLEAQERVNRLEHRISEFYDELDSRPP